MQEVDVGSKKANSMARDLRDLYPRASAWTAPELQGWQRT